MTQAQTIELYQPLLHSIAYRLLRCKEEAEDIVQDTFVRWLSIDQTKIENTKAYLITAVTNNCLNHLKSLKQKKEEYWDSLQLADKLGKFWEIDFSHIDIEAEVGAALKVLQSKLEPLERAVFLLKEVFNFDYETLQEILDKKNDHIRQLFCRAKKKMNIDPETLEKTQVKTTPLFENFRKACQFGNIADLLSDLRLEVAEVMGKK